MAGFAQADIRIGSFDGSRTGRPFAGSDFDNLRGMLLDPNNFGPAGIVAEVVTLQPPVAAVDAATLAGYDVFFITEVTSLAVGEISALQAWVAGGGVLIMESNSTPASRPGAHLMLQALDGGAVVDPMGGGSGGTVGVFVASLSGPFGAISAGDTFASSPGSTLVPGSLTTLLGTNAGLSEIGVIAAGTLGPTAGGVLVATDVLFMDYFVPPATLSGNQNNARLFMNFVASAPVNAPSLSGTKQASGVFFAGSTVTYTVVLGNTGAGPQPDNPTDEFTDTVPPELAVTAVGASSGNAAHVGNAVTWNGAIPAGGSVTITITATILAAGGTTVTNQGTVHFDADGNGSNETAVPTDDPGQPGEEDATAFDVSNPVPTLSPAALAALALLLAAAALVALRR